MASDKHHSYKPERDLACACADGHDASWDRFIEGYADLIRSTVRLTLLRYKPEQLEALLDDVCQEVYAAFLENEGRRLRQFEGRRDCSLATWLRLVVSRLTIDFLRKQARHEKQQVQAGKQNIEVLPADPRELPENLIASAHEKDFVDKALATLNTRDKLLMKLLYDDDLPVETAARIIGVKPGAVYTRLSRIRNTLSTLAEKAGLKM